ncbi:MFS transporter [Haematobacter genomosp. 1]|uniref:MFS transporter n=1 Tax=Haematobacter genomosp. 1 TaxID=366618 RepID=A0A212AAU9_9RHOB|nr:MFS transporter [Haematobacter genomosp. 1]OWJ77427.1 MFS transporter [Haematobacter genomosp. 1]
MNTQVAAQSLSIPALVAVMAGVTLVTLDISLTSTAIPAIASGLHVDPARAIWIINVYYLAVVAALLPLATLGEIHGHRKVFIGGLTLFAFGALLSGAATSLPALAGARAVLGIGSAAVSATTPALIRTIFPPHRLSRGLGLYAMIVGTALAAGPPIASTILSVLDWHWLFWQSVPIVLITTVLALLWMPESELNVRRFDPASAALCALTFACLLFAIAGAAHLGARTVIWALTAFAMSAALLIWRDRDSPAPMLGADLFRIPVFALSSLTSILSFSVQGLVFVVLPFLFQLRLGYSQIEAGLLILPWPITLAMMTIISSRLTERMHPGALGGIGLSMLAVGLATLATLPPEVEGAAIIWRLVLCGIGFGFFQSPNMVAIMSSAPRSRSGSAGGVLAMSRLLGQAIGAALVAFCMMRWTQSGVEIALWAGVAFAVAGSAVSLVRLIPTLNLRIE